MSTADETPATDRRSADIGIVCSFSAEIAPLVTALDRAKQYSDRGFTFRGGFIDEVIRVAIVEAGEGFAQHRDAAAILFNEHNPPWILSVGHSLGLTTDVEAGDVCLANHLADTHGNSRNINCPIPAKGRIKVGPHIVADSLPIRLEDRKSLAETSAALACDTTSLAVAQVCEESSGDDRTINFLSIRSIFSNFAEDLPPETIAANFAAPPPTNLLAAVTNRFRSKPKTDWDIRAEEQVRNLNRFALGVIRQLAEKLGKRGW